MPAFLLKLINKFSEISKEGQLQEGKRSRFPQKNGEGSEERCITKMREFSYIIESDNGLHARPAACLVKAAQRYQCNLKISCKGREADAKKLFEIIMLNAQKGDWITVMADGPDESVAYNDLKRALRVE